MSFASFFRWLFGRKKKKSDNTIVLQADAPLKADEDTQAVVPVLAEPEKTVLPEISEATVAVSGVAEEPEKVLEPEKATDEVRPESAIAAKAQAPAQLTAPFPAIISKPPFVRTRYNRSFTARLIQADDAVKGFYCEIKNELLSYGVKSRISWRYETFRLGRKLLVKLVIRGKSLYVYLALDPKVYEGGKYKIKDVSNTKSNASVPVLYKIKNARRCKYVKQLIADVMAANGLAQGDVPAFDYAAQYPYMDVEQLIARQLIKIILIEDKEPAVISEAVAAEPEEDEVEEEDVDDDDDDDDEEEVEEPSEAVSEPEPDIVEEEVVAEPEKYVQPEEIKESVSVYEAEENISDEEVEAFVYESKRVADKAKKAIVNIDDLGKHFKKGEKVTVKEIAERIPSVGKNVTYIKVLARGTLNKPLTVEADDFSPAAIKMIVLTGGKVIRTKKN